MFINNVDAGLFYYYIRYEESIELRKPYQTEERPDEWYVVGRGKLIPVKSEDEATRVIKRLQTNVD